MLERRIGPSCKYICRIANFSFFFLKPFSSLWGCADRLENVNARPNQIKQDLDGQGWIALHTFLLFHRTIYFFIPDLIGGKLGANYAKQAAQLKQQVLRYHLTTGNDLLTGQSETFRFIGPFWGPICMFVHNEIMPFDIEISIWKLIPMFRTQFLSSSSNPTLTPCVTFWEGQKQRRCLITIMSFSLLDCYGTKTFCLDFPPHVPSFTDCLLHMCHAW